MRPNPRQGEVREADVDEDVEETGVRCRCRAHEHLHPLKARQSRAAILDHGGARDANDAEQDGAEPRRSLERHQGGGTCWGQMATA